MTDWADEVDWLMRGDYCEECGEHLLDCLCAWDGLDPEDTDKDPGNPEDIDGDHETNLSNAGSGLEEDDPPGGFRYEEDPDDD